MGRKKYNPDGGVYNDKIKTTNGYAYKCACADCDNEISPFVYDLKNYVFKFHHAFSDKGHMLIYCCSYTCMMKMKSLLNHKYTRRYVKSNKE